MPPDSHQRPAPPEPVRGRIFVAYFQPVDVATSLAVGVRRLHDTNRSGWWILLPLAAALPGVPLMDVSPNLGLMVSGLGICIGSIVIIVFMCIEGTRGDNRFGPDPTGPNLTEVFA